MADFPFAGAPNPECSSILAVCDAERERQRMQLVMIPSESICHPAAAEILSCDLGNVYAEGDLSPSSATIPRTLPSIPRASKAGARASPTSASTRAPSAPTASSSSPTSA